MKKKSHAIVNVQALPEPQRVRYRRKAFECWKRGMTAYAAAKACGVWETTVGKWYAKFRKLGEAAVRGGRRGPKPGGEKHKLSDAQLAKLKRTVTDKTPDQLKFDFALWSSKAVAEYVLSEFGQRITRRTARRYMRKLGFTCQRPVRFAREQNPAHVEKWLRETYPAIRREAAERGATVLWADESSVLACETESRGYSPRGVPPVLRSPANRSVRCNMVSAVGNRGDMRFMVFDGAMTAGLFREFMERLVRDAEGAVFLIVDNLRVHHARCLAPWLEEHRSEIRLFYLPSYSPELNPDEYLNRDLKANLAEQSRPASAKALRDRVEAHLSRRKDDRPAIVRLFHKPEVRYAAD